MINTVNTKRQQLNSGYFSIGSGSEVMLFIGSCRTVPYLNYFAVWNHQNGNRFTITFIDPFNFCYDLQDNRIDVEVKINSLETSDVLLSLFKSVKIFIHEYYANFGMFNCDKNSQKNIYQFGLNPEIDICIPNWNDCFVLFGDIVSMDMSIRKKAIADYNVIGKLSDVTQKEIYEISQKNLQKFYDVCFKSNVPEMMRYFADNYLLKRFYWNSNHVSKHFTLAIFKFINEKFLKLDMPEAFLKYISHEDMFANNYTFLNEYDKLWYNYEWDEEVIPLKLI